jgi:hypothetical protein
VFDDAEVREFERSIQEERAWLRGRLGEPDAIRGFP